ncbi:MAG: GNAT family N-acetyltransferase [Clostridia bacterium]
MIKIIEYSSLYKEELYDFIFSIIVTDVKKEPNALKKELIDLDNIEVYYKSNFWLAIDNGKIIGSIGLLVKDEVGEIKRVYVSKDYRRKGIGTLLYNKLEQISKNMKIKELQLSVGINLENAHHFYEKIGYTRYGISENGNSYRYKKTI